MHIHAFLARSSGQSAGLSRAFGVSPLFGLLLSGLLSQQRPSSARHAKAPFSWSRSFTGSVRVDHVTVPCASSGQITLSLYNVLDRPPTASLLLYLPPHPTDDAEPLPLPPPPSFLQDYPVVAIRYRWSLGVGGDDGPGAAVHLLWPTPLHDVMFGYDWVRKNLAPPLAAKASSADGRRHRQRRDLYVYGSRLGAGLAAALALTETYPLQRIAVRGVAAYNGIYNWTAFVEEKDGTIQPGETLRMPPLPSLFAKPADLFDSFASPKLFLHTSGYVVPPPDFEGGYAAMDEEERLRTGKGAGAGTGTGTTTTAASVVPGLTRKAYLGFPPRRSALAIPAALFLHESPEAEAKANAETTATQTKRGRPPSAETKRREKHPEATVQNNSYAMQALELADLLKRSIERDALRERRESGIDGPPPDDVARRVRTVDVGDYDGDEELGSQGQEALLDWLDEQTDRTDASR